ncbi:hypothetical protein FB472_0387 [Rhodoglobus vestalii]|uniref:Helicase associated protein n=1 Tax=Rhodoglobus vestalii TaxID=193384 RepID=A0A8H2K478_9MICO|nr:helicase associated domain-containing protein [Rhodoglobus vestalii]TQO18860.1 hypothetical protein FB472_0387 [Rhodoglobus vestalii]
MESTGLLEIHKRAASEYDLGERDPQGASFLEAERVFLALSDRPSIGASQRALNWTSKLYRYELFAAESGRTPREHTRNRATLPAEERRLGEWGGYQRRMQDRLTRFQWIRLDFSSAFEWDPNDSKWQVRLDEYRAHLESTGRQPFHNSGDPHEFRVARWVARQLYSMRSGTLPAERVIQFESLITITKP